MSRKSSKLKESIIDTADEMLECGLISEKKHKKITMHLLKGKEQKESIKMTSDDIKAIREKAHLSQAVFAHYLNMSTGQLSKLERGEKKPTGPLLVIFNIMKTKGSDFIQLIEETQGRIESRPR